jgi:hypothetical protein
LGNYDIVFTRPLTFTQIKTNIIASIFIAFVFILWASDSWYIQISDYYSNFYMIYINACIEISTLILIWKAQRNSRNLGLKNKQSFLGLDLTQTVITIVIVISSTSG